MKKATIFAVFLLAMFSAVTLQKTIRDNQDGISVTKVFLGMCWIAFAAAIALLVIGLVNATLLLSEKGFYGMSFFLALFAIITVQKNIRDVSVANDYNESNSSLKSTGEQDVVNDNDDVKN
ncbi:YiaA/YiaB family inner membrane protein [Psychrosphaera sp. 1_MG-2023]|uniref:YiaA/YiaB family inner membrane protein n=1 Tax=unclassified Psychrosphaera TaxID=2641570 RepID=UPI0020900B4D|nr:MULTISPECIES: YiaA/YiaB family inner membrane protein [unclassified Psychrosphaera]MDO6719141.1 YiaA/YiaB family inner membrane protein [Psychrosphaera sp. 1_MG-2023]